MPKAPPDLAVFTANAAHVADVLRALANERRLMILCKLVEWGEATSEPWSKPWDCRNRPCRSIWPRCARKAS